MVKITYEDVKPILVDIVGTDIIDPEKDTIDVLGMDSLDVCDIILKIENKYHIEINNVDKFNTHWTISKMIEEMNNNSETDNG